LPQPDDRAAHEHGLPLAVSMMVPTAILGSM
jgi:hypothetical protein